MLLLIFISLMGVVIFFFSQVKLCWLSSGRAALRVYRETVKQKLRAWFPEGQNNRQLGVLGDKKNLSFVAKSPSQLGHATILHYQNFTLLEHLHCSLRTHTYFRPSLVLPINRQLEIRLRSQAKHLPVMRKFARETQISFISQTMN